MLFTQNKFFIFFYWLQSDISNSVSTVEQIVSTNTLQIFEENQHYCTSIY